MMDFSHKVGELVMWKHPYDEFKPLFGIIIDRQHDLYTRYKVQWFNKEGFNHYAPEEVLELKSNFKKWVKDAKSKGW